MEWLDLAKSGGPAIAGLGVIFSIYKFRRERKPAVRVECTYGLIAVGAESSEWQLLLEAANTGHRPVMLASTELALPGGKKMVSPWGWGSTAQLPHRLDP